MEENKLIQENKDGAENKEKVESIQSPESRKNTIKLPDDQQLTKSPISGGIRKISDKKQSKLIILREKQSQQLEKKKSSAASMGGKGTCCEKVRKCLDSFLENIVVSTIMTIITVYALFGDDIRQLAAPESADETFWTLNIAVMAAFTIEIVISCISKPGYIFGFFFWLDLISTLSLLLDIGWVSNSLFGETGSSKASSAASLARAGRASRVGTKAGRIVRIVRLIRLVKLYKHAQQALQKEADLADEVENGIKQADEHLPKAENRKNNKFAKAADVVMKEQKVLSIVDKGSNHRDDTPINNTGFNLNNTNTIDLEQNGQPLLATEKKQSQIFNNQPPKLDPLTQGATKPQSGSSIEKDQKLDRTKSQLKQSILPSLKPARNKVLSSNQQFQTPQQPGDLSLNIYDPAGSHLKKKQDFKQANMQGSKPNMKSNNLDQFNSSSSKFYQKQGQQQSLTEKPQLILNYQIYKEFKKQQTKSKRNPDIKRYQVNPSVSNQINKFNEFQQELVSKFPQYLEQNTNMPVQNGDENNENMKNRDDADKKNKTQLINLDDKKKDLDDNQGLDQGTSFLRNNKKMSTVDELEKKKKEFDISPQFQQTKVGQQLSDLTTKRVIMLVMSIMISVTLFSSDTYVQSYGSYKTGLRYIYAFSTYADTTLMKSAMSYYLSYHTSKRNPIIYVEFTGITDTCCNLYPGTYFTGDPVDYKDLRTSEQTTYALQVDGNQVGFSISDDRKDAKLNSVLSIIRTVFVSLVLSIGALLFSKDVEDLVLQPIENMLGKVKKIAENPLEAAEIEVEQAMLQEKLLAEGDKKEIKKKEEESKMETVILESLIIKIGALLAVGFGEAGSEIIAKNMKQGGRVDPMIAGIKIAAVFGFCDIRDFSDITEVLQSKVMMFVNRIALIVHGTVDQFCGQPNKNIGDSFLLVWRYSDKYYEKKEDGSIELKKDARVKEFSNLSVMAFIKILANINMSTKLLEYKRDPSINKRLPNYTIKMGFGLHQGWGIEGAIGSEYKIDASYLSPNVNMASRLEAATRQFGVNLFISGELYDMLTTRCQKNLRHVDTVKVKGSDNAMRLYTCDLSFDNLQKKVLGSDKFENENLTRAQKKKKKVIDRRKRNKRRDEIEEGKQRITDLFLKDKEIVAMREIFTEEFYNTYALAMVQYIEGRWEEAEKLFSKTLKLIPGHIDGPSKTLLEVLHEHKLQKPDNWKGFRVLTEK